DVTLDLAKLGAQAKGVQAAGSGPIKVPLVSVLSLSFSFGFNSNQFFTKLPPGGIDLFNTINKAGLDFPIGVGMSNADVAGGQVELNARTTVTVNDLNGDGQFSLDELTTANTHSVQAGSLTADVPFTAQVGTNQNTGEITITDNDLSDD